jgi:hypothetical protein
MFIFEVTAIAVLGFVYFFQQIFVVEVVDFFHRIPL